MATLVDLLRQYRIDVAPEGHRHVRSGWVGVDCPYCSPGWKKYRLGFEISTGRTNCWVCGLQYGPKVFVDLFRITEREARDLWFGLPKSWTPRPPSKQEGSLKVPAGVGDLLPAHLKYLKVNRRFSNLEDLIRIWGIKGIGLASKLKWRIFIPVHDDRGRQVSWTTRSISDNSGVRYVSASEDEEIISHKSVLYGEHHASHTIIINEGPLDAWVWGPGGVATLGVNYSERQLACMVQYPVRVVCFDSERHAQRRADELCRQLAAFPGVTDNIELETGKDASSAERDEILEIREKYGLG